MNNTLIKGWNYGQIKAEFSRATAELSDKAMRKPDSEMRKRKFASLLNAYQAAPQRLCCTNGVKDSQFESSMIAGGHEQLDPDEVQDHELVGLQ